METLEQIYQKHKKGDWPDKGSIHSYIEVYEELLAPYRSTDRNVAEIGLFNGNSLRMWEEYFYKYRPIGIDCSETPHDGMADLRPMINEGGHFIYIGDAANENWVNKMFLGYAPFDVIIEDASHDLPQQLKIYSVWKNRMNKGGIYIIEDIQDIDATREVFEELGGEIIDRRHIKNRYDDVLVIIKK